MLGAGSAFPDRALRDPGGSAHRLSETWARGPALLAVGHADCATTRLLLPCLQRLHERAGGRVAVILQDEPETAQALARELAIASLPIRLDPDPYALSASLGLEIVPAQHLVGRDGRVVRATEGFSRDDLEGFARELGVPGPLFGPDDAGPRHRPG